MVNSKRILIFYSCLFLPIVVLANVRWAYSADQCRQRQRHRYRPQYYKQKNPIMRGSCLNPITLGGG